eukprot:TRINITY_DN64926_c0_g1_i1.p1 TRINITY_DN64926_c0_g1~~TRINITY_DN64926_c0_g1_i1.p1  ORF type:complete len:421 (-),score=195.82 TRINITY_DN64926_c0_g1_i1:163-1425(-)
MAPKTRSGGKRASTAPHSEEPPAKKLATTLKKHGVTQASYKVILEALSNPLLDVPEQCRKMLIAMAPQSICVPVDERQEFQEIGVQMISDAMTKLQGALQKAVDEENEKVAGAESTKGELETNVAAAEGALNAAQEATAAKTTALATASEGVVASGKALAAAEEEQRNGDAGLVVAKSDKEALEAALAENFAKLKAGECEEGQTQTLFIALRNLMGKVTMDESLKSAVPGALTKQPSARGGFDHTVIDEFEKAFKTKIAELEASLASAQPDSEARAQAVAAAMEAKEAAAKAQQEASADLLAAKETQKEATAALKAAKAAVTANKPEYTAATSHRDEKQAELDAYVDQQMAMLATLKEKISAKKLRAQAAEAAAEAAAQAAKEAEEAEAAAAAAAEAEAAAAPAEAATAEAETADVSMAA